MRDTNAYAAPTSRSGGHGHATADGNYEFGASQNNVMTHLAGSMKFVGIVFVVIGGVVATGGIAAIVLLVLGRVVALAGFSATLWGGGMLAISAVIGGVVYGLQGVELVGSAAEFRLVGATEGHGIEHLMAALAKLRKFYIAATILTTAGTFGALMAMVHRP